MDFWTHLLDEWTLYEWQSLADDWVFVFAMAFFLFEIIRLVIKKEMTWATAGDCFANFVTLVAHVGLVAVFAGVYLAAFYLIYPTYSLTLMPSNYWTVALCIILADLAYYFEHRVAHRMGLGWATHTVHHSSPYFNISVAYRHGPLDAIFGLPFYIPLVFIGFDPFLVLLSASLVQLYQTLLHTDTIGKLPRFYEAVMNTPSHHRVHHGSNPQYIDKNYAGIFIIWDKMFGTFAEEEETVIYGVSPPIKSVNPIVVFFHGFTGLTRKIWHAKGLSNKLAYLIQPPGWHPKNDQ
ncbi:sterol desaturase family protein [Kiloniella sp. EL199]|uniref:sterol desaturase family protein n=1 Tax=Kiloniella sp. EL199 TaxID=2107581 RepID=UPI000EA03C45|nr:sterol desaturase family protein [Kiloniella sp. EL199]